MKKKAYTFISCLLCIVFFSSTIVFAKEEISVTNQIETGVVDIELSEYMKNDQDELISWEKNIILLPGMEVSQIPRITNVGYDCYVRAKVDISLDVLKDSYFDIGENWIKCKDGYWYYTKILKTGEYTDIFQGIKMPTDFSPEYEGKKVELKIAADAIQIQNFIPNYESDNPWGDVEIKECIQNGKYNVQSLTVKDPKSFEIQYDGESKKLIKNEDDFFLNIPVLFPGDTYTDTLKLKNDSGNLIKLYFRTLSDNKDLLNKIKLKIVLKNNVEEKLIYSGSLNSKQLEEQILLTQIAKNGQQELIYTIEVPKELDNQYTLLNEQVRWMFSVDEIKNDKVHSGDSSTANISFVVMMISAMSIIVVLKKQRDEERK